MMLNCMILIRRYYLIWESSCKTKFLYAIKLIMQNIMSIYKREFILNLYLRALFCDSSV